MSDIQILHNPRCSKSRQTLALLEEKGIEPDIIKYLDTPPSAAELKQILQKLGISARDLLRKGEDDYKALNLKDPSLSEDELINAMVKHPKLIERPIVIKDNKARLGRPPESVLDII
ncbi:arsenate reductase (glutaredoxin) [Methylophaga sp.]|jgi:arsenate reductase|uniref:arsenate reductase (glutaredoxin) n=1 Tax=Methylophaga sp. TaxID=2024840 RepID=UPI0013FFE130|nr:arsenate reductase (glutaredoxin) [Methylophaga sp.]MTI62630.1 arsenate reductase (glutaredoxin) [Methylophaga sp.]